MSLTFRQATEKELPHICEIIRQAQKRMRLRGTTQWQNGYPAPQHIQADKAQGYGYVLCNEGGEVIAYGAVVFDGEPVYDAIQGAWLDEVPYVVVHRLAVADQACGQGVATEFLRRTIALAGERGITSFRIDTHPDNEPMLRLLRRLEFIHCGKVFYDGGERIAFQKLLSI